MNTFTEAWDQLDKKKGLTENDTSVTMTPKQFRHMLQQFYDMGFRHGRKHGHNEGVQSAKNLSDITDKGDGLFGSGIDFDSIFGGDKK